MVQSGTSALKGAPPTKGNGMWFKKPKDGRQSQDVASATVDETDRLMKRLADTCEPNAPMVTTYFVQGAVRNLLSPRHVTNLTNWQAHCLVQARFSSTHPASWMELPPDEPAPQGAILWICKATIADTQWELKGKHVNETA